jgi:hypothetical protein
MISIPHIGQIAYYIDIDSTISVSTIRDIRFKGPAYHGVHNSSWESTHVVLANGISFHKTLVFASFDQALTELTEDKIR